MTELPDPPQPTVDAILGALVAEAAVQPRYEGYGIAASALGTDCNRALWYGLRWASVPNAVDGRRLRIFERGNWEEARLVADLRRAGLEVLEGERQFAFTLADGWLRGKVDGRCWGVIEAPKAEHVLEIKSLKAADWRAIRKHGLRKAKPEHWHQLHAGMAGLGVARGLYIATNKDTEEILTERLHLDAEEAARQEARVQRIVAADEPPGRIADKPEALACRFCNHRTICHGAAFARRHCRTCLHFSFASDGNGHCARFDQSQSPKGQALADECPAHLYLPGLVPGEQIDADPQAETVTYAMSDGSEWIDGAQEE